jgi:hypothetical protein
MVANPATPKLDEAKHILPAASAAWSSRLQLRSTLIAKHQFASPAAQLLSISDTKATTQQFRTNALQNEKATRQQGSLFSQGRIVPTELLSIRTFCRNLMSLKSIVSSKICDLNTLIFNNLQDVSTSRQTAPKWAEAPAFRV